KKIYLIKSGIGEIYASGATAILITLFKCDVILNFGVCGSLNENVSVCDALVINGVVHYDFDLSKIDETKVGQYPGKDVILKTNENLLNLALSVNPNLKSGICASADKFVADEDFKINLNKEFNADVCDMESAGVLLTALNANVPTLIIKAVSDGKGGAEEFNRRVFEASKVYLDTLNEIIERL
ncbi:MAG: 5'-methylthioadenosine/S-adenosylhomocysteine nucleosidase, partial [Clostridia bacterium]|nr:5'-methylthioadenosine/S-adenosylhomocysteine nucleosidase [Clostridia bacterium]